MKPLFHYAPVAEAIAALKQQGFTTDFNIQGNSLIAGDQLFTQEGFKVVDVYRYEGESDPADEATVYAIIATSGIKGILVTGYGNNSGDFSSCILNKMNY